VLHVNCRNFWDRSQYLLAGSRNEFVDLLFNWWEFWALVYGRFRNEKVVCFEWEITLDLLYVGKIDERITTNTSHSLWRISGVLLFYVSG